MPIIKRPFSKVFKGFFYCLFLIPALADILFTSQIFFSLFDTSLPLWLQPFSWLLLVGVFLSPLLYLFLLVHFLSLLFGKKVKLLSLIDKIYNVFRLPILVSSLLSLSTFTQLFFSIWPLNLITIDFPTSTTLALLTKLCILLASYILFVLLPHSRTYFRISLGIATIVLIASLGFSGFFLFSIAQELLPHEYFTFPLDDPKGQYVMNYDGDYWVTYYTVEKLCSNDLNDKPICTDTWKKTGNTSITESPVELADYIDRPVRLKGTFTPTHGSLWEDKKQLCIGKGFKKTCKVSPGPGGWYASPLKITSISLE